MSRTTDRLGAHFRAIYDDASFSGDVTALDNGVRELRAAEAQLALARGRFLHAQYLKDRTDRPEELAHFTEAARSFSDLGDIRAEADATFWAATYHQVVRGDDSNAVPLLERALHLANEAGDPLVMSYVLRHLAFVDVDAGRLDQGKERFEESVRLRRQIDFFPGVAAGLIPLADLAVRIGDRATAERLLGEAETICRDHELRAVAQWVAEARARHDLPPRT